MYFCSKFPMSIVSVCRIMSASVLEQNSAMAAMFSVTGTMMNVKDRFVIPLSLFVKSNLSARSMFPHIMLQGHQWAQKNIPMNEYSFTMVLVRV